MDDKGGQKGYGGYSSRKNTHASTAEDMLNNLDDIKGRVFRTFEETTPSKFRTFFKSSKYDKFLQALIYYFVNLFKLHNLKSKKDGLGNDLVIESCTKEVEKTFFKLGSIYAQIILTQSGEVTHIQQDRMFWETLYDAPEYPNHYGALYSVYTSTLHSQSQPQIRTPNLRATIRHSAGMPLPPLLLNLLSFFCNKSPHLD